MNLGRSQYAGHCISKYTNGSVAQFFKKLKAHKKQYRIYPIKRRGVYIC